MRIRPPEVRAMHRNLWAGMTGASVQQRAAAAPPQADPQPSPTEVRLRQLKELGELRDQGVLTEEEFRREKKRLLE